mmetsp:Transcript_35127/g.35765  ORF Transcript_35127/g.35765 Transcript_35127/m.35765 type:complete len:183 (-) Transcript_35127:154-702(-)
MSNEENPSWLSESAPGNGSSTSVPGADTASTTPASTSANAAPVKNKALVKGILLILNCGIAVMMSATGALGVGHAQSASDTGNVFVGIYMILFASILFTFEIIQIRPCTSIDEFYKKNFGFLYGMIGKGLYTFFIAILSFGLSYPKTLSIATGVVVSFVGLGQIILYMKFPQYFDIKEKYQP